MSASWDRRIRIMDLSQISSPELQQEIERVYKELYKNYSMEKFLLLLLWRGLAHTERIKSDCEGNENV